MRAVFTTIPYNVADIHLASLVPNIANPHQDAITLNRGLKKPEISKRSVRDFSAYLSNQSNASFRNQITKLFSLAHEDNHVDGLKLEAVSGYVYELKSPIALFAELCTSMDEAERVRLENTKRGGLSEYFVVGYFTFLDGAMQAWDKNRNANTASLDLPVSQAATAATGGAGAPLSNTLNISAQGGYATADTVLGALTTPGERIYAICYRRVTYKIFKKGDIDAASLKPGNSWVMINQKRGVHAENKAAVVISLELGDLDLYEDHLEVEYEGSENGTTEYLCYGVNAIRDDSGDDSKGNSKGDLEETENLEND
ncbi:hypothetical protein SLS56_012069 [Neofusicoccum ribis]|uniref:Uncharacterized protein n=1 Tax=Neofusicoccum ribis TaxID=45134 RepID=A0ABR3S9W2_9PEZI